MKALWVAITDLPVLKNILTAKAWCTLVQPMIVTDCIYKKMGRH